MTAAFWTGWPGIDFRWRPGGGGIAFACGNVGRRKRARNAARGVVADEAWRNREALLPLVDWGPARTRAECADCRFRAALTGEAVRILSNAAVLRGCVGTLAAGCSGAC